MKTVYSAGDHVDDYCRPCKMLRDHTVLVTGSAKEPLRVICGYCGSQHNYRGAREPGVRPARTPGSGPHSSPAAGQPWSLVSDRERSAPPMSLENGPADIEMLLRRVIREETGLTDTPPGDRWRGGDLVLRPGKEGVQEKVIPIETFFSKIVMVRNRLRTLEQQINSADLPNDVKLKIQGYITGAYGSLTSFNVLFADEEDRFKGSGGK